MTTSESLQLRQVVLLPAARETLFVLSGSRCVRVATHGSFDPAAAWSLLSDGTPLPDVARTLGCPASDLRDFVDELARADLTAAGSSAEDSIPREAAVTQIEAASRMWKRHSILHPLYRYLGDSTPRPTLLLALIAEICHYTRTVPDIARTAAARARHDVARTALTNYALEEGPHHRSIAEGLAAALHVPVENVLASRPCPGMIGLLALLRQIASESAAGFAAALCFLELDSSMAPRASQDFDALAARNGVPAEAVAPVAAHAAADDDLGHGDLAVEILRAELSDPLTAEDLNVILNGVHDVKHAFDALYDELTARWLDSERPYVLRRSADCRLLAAT